MKALAFVFVLCCFLCFGAAAAQPPSIAATASSGEAAAPAPSAAGAPSSTAAATAPRPAPARAAAQAELDRSTPRQTVTGLMRWVAEGQPARAAQYLDLRGLRWGEQTPAEAAEQLAELLTLHVWVRPESISDVPEGRPEDGADVERIATLESSGAEIPITLSRVQRGGDSLWLFSEQTVARIPELHATTGAQSWIKPLVPESFASVRFWGLWGWQWLALLLALLIGYPLGYLLATAAVALLMRVALRTTARWDNAVLDALRSPLRVALGMTGFALLSQSLDIPGRAEEVLDTWVAIPIILASGWAVIRGVRALINVYIADVSEGAEMTSRGVRTHLVIVRKLSSVAIGIITVAIALTQFNVVRDIGLSLLASAGVAGVALGFAAQKSLGAAIAGLQLAITQPLRLGDAIVWQGQWGTVEEIALTWVRLKLFDERRLVVPVDKFLTEPFENWSVPGDEMIGLVELPVDPSAPVAELRAELERVARAHPGHDGRECLLQLIDVDEARALLRARVSTSDVGNTFAMRCDLREAMMNYLQRLHGGRYLARRRWQEVDAPSRAA